MENVHATGGDLPSGGSSNLQPVLRDTTDQGPQMFLSALRKPSSATEITTVAKN